MILHVRASAQDEEAAFLSALRAALQTKDAAAFASMLCFDGFDDAARTKMERQIPLLYLHDDFKSAEYVPPVDPPQPYTHERVTYAANLKPEKAILVKFERAGAPNFSSQTCLWLGRKNGKLLIILAPPTPVSQ